MSWAERAKAGDEIVCVMGYVPRRDCGGGFWQWLKFNLVLEQGKVFRIACVKLNARGTIYFKLQGAADWMLFRWDIFKPVSKRGTAQGMAVLRALLTPSKQEIDA